MIRTDQHEVPIWSGCFWAQGETPATPSTPDVKVLKTESATLTIVDTPGVETVTIETNSGKRIKIDSTGIEIEGGQLGRIKLTDLQVSINNGALEVT